MSKLTTELIEKLEDQKKHLRPYGDDTASSMMRLNTEEINAILAALDSSEHKAKCVQFAEDVEKLKIREIWGPRYIGDVWTIFHLKANRRLMTEGPDIYTAARSAVESLAKGEGA